MSGWTMLAAVTPPAIVFLPVAAAVWLLYLWISAEDPEAGRAYFVVPAVVIPVLAVVVFRLVRASWDVMSPNTARLLRTQRGIAWYSRADSYMKWTALPMLAATAVAAVAGEAGAIAGLVGCSEDEDCVIELFLTLMAFAWLGGLGLSLTLIRLARRGRSS